MGNQDVKRKQATFTLDIGTIERLKKVSDRTLIPQARLVEMGIQKVLQQYEKEEQQG